METAFLTGINWIAVFCAALAYFALGAIWYSKVLFAKKWLELTRIDPKNTDATKGMAGIMIASFVLMFITATGLAILRNRLDIAGTMGGVKLGLVTGICFGAAAISISYLYEKRPKGLHLINDAYTLAGNIIAAVIICIWP
ncbi:MAG: DUF1761 domain-containing protein [Ferruginibacter sp.]